MISRRNFLGLVGIGGVAVATGIVIKVTNSSVKVDDKIVDQLDRQPSTITLHSYYSDPPYNETFKVPADAGTILISGCAGGGGSSGITKISSVKMSPGPDGNLYIHVGNSWKKVATE